MDEETTRKLVNALQRMDDLKKFGVTEEWGKAISHCKHIITSEFKYKGKND